jgi:hypothetical protein
MAEKTSRVGFRWRPEVTKALADAARADGRSMSAWAEMIVAAWLSESRAKARPRGTPIFGKLPQKKGRRK